MIDNPEQSTSALEKELDALRVHSENDRLALIRNIMLQMADTAPRQVVIGTYPACNSEA